MGCGVASARRRQAKLRLLYALLQRRWMGARETVVTHVPGRFGFEIVFGGSGGTPARSSLADRSLEWQQAPGP